MCRAAGGSDRNRANTISNSTVMPVANGSRNCTPTNPALASIDVEPAVMAGPVTYGTINVDRI